MRVSSVPMHQGPARSAAASCGCVTFGDGSPTRRSVCGGMMSIWKLRVGAESYYLAQVATEPHGVVGIRGVHR